MVVKSILDKIHRQEIKKITPYFALQIEEGLVKSALWTVEGGVVNILSLGSNETWTGEEDLLEAIDHSISLASEGLQTISEIEEPTQVILGLPLTWIEDNKIAPKYLEQLRQIFKKLDLTPAGFVVTVEALVHHLKIDEGIPPTAILLGLRKKKANIALVKLGKTAGVEIVERSENLEEDLLEGLSRFGNENTYPSRILLYDSGNNLDEIKQRLTAYPWSTGKINFLHLPKIEVLPDDFDIKSVALAGGREIAQASSVVMENKPKEEPLVETVVEDKEDKETVVSEVTNPPTENFGFVENKDIQNVEEVKPEIAVSEPEFTVKSSKPQINFLSWFKLPKLGNKTLAVPIVVVIVLVLVLSGLFAAYWYLPKAKISLKLAPNTMEKDFTIKLDPQLTEANEDELILPGEMVKSELESEKSKSTTGTKTIGDPAKGEVTIYNRTSSEKKLASGVKLTGPNNLYFTIDEEVIVASQSAGSDYTLVPGKATVKVTAGQIGGDSNLANGSEFSIEKFAKADFIARSNGDFSGGTSREIQAVSKEDQETLRKDLVEELKSKALSELTSKAPAGRKIIEDSVTSKAVEEKFSAKIGEEANTLTLNEKVEFSALVYNQETLSKIIEDEVKKAVPEGFRYSENENNYNFEVKEISKENVVLLTVKFKTKLIPQIETDKIRRDLVGKTPTIAQQYLVNIQNVKQAEIVFSPKLPGRILTMPRIAENINFELSLE